MEVYSVALKWGVPKRAPSDEIEKLVSENVQCISGKWEICEYKSADTRVHSFHIEFQICPFLGEYFLSSRRR